MTFLESIDKEKSKKKLLIVISALTLVALALLLVIIVVSIAPGGIKGFKNYTVTAKDINTGTLILADDDHPYNYTIDASSLELCSSYRNANLKKDENGDPINKYILFHQLYQLYLYDVYMIQLFLVYRSYKHELYHLHLIHELPHQ